jgi:hypothetical protein
MVKEKRDKRLGDPIHLFLEKSLTRQMDEMMETFTEILRRLLKITYASSSSDHFGGDAHFKVQVNFYISIFEGQIDVDALEKWLYLLEGYFFVHSFSNRENITFVLLKVVPHVKN